MFSANKKKIVVAIILLVATLVLAVSFFTGFNITYAETNYILEQYSSNDELLKKYTDTDFLIDDDGSELTETITSFAAEVKSKKGYVEVTDLTKVIPAKYVRFIEDGYTFHYCDKEYGFL